MGAQLYPSGSRGPWPRSPAKHFNPWLNCPKKAPQAALLDEASEERARGIWEEFKPMNASDEEAAKAGMLHPRSKGRTDKTCCFNTPHPKPQRQLRLTLPRHIFHLASESSFYTRRAFQTSREGSYIPKSCPLPFKPLARPWRSGHT